MPNISTDIDGLHVPEGNINVATGAKYKVNGSEGSVIAAVASTTATDLASAIAMVNELKAQFNAQLAQLKTKGLLKT